tara:strand:+ start:272 stop:466 length:195 start_codon:yes stop_codon:yes gene_type:complete
MNIKELTLIVDCGLAKYAITNPEFDLEDEEWDGIVSCIVEELGKAYLTKRANKDSQKDPFDMEW